MLCSTTTRLARARRRDQLVHRRCAPRAVTELAPRRENARERPPVFAWASRPATGSAMRAARAAGARSKDLRGDPLRPRAGRPLSINLPPPMRRSATRDFCPLAPRQIPLRWPRRPLEVPHPTSSPKSSASNEPPSPPPPELRAILARPSDPELHSHLPPLNYLGGVSWRAAAVFFVVGGRRRRAPSVRGASYAVSSGSCGGVGFGARARCAG